MFSSVVHENFFFNIAALLQVFVIQEEKEYFLS